MRRAVALLALALLAACGSRGERSTPRAAPTAAVQPGLPLEELPAQTLTRGQCALVLWSRTTPTRRLLMALNEPPSVRVQVGGRTLALGRTATAGETAFGHHPNQTYAGEGVTVAISAEFDAREGLVGGAAVPSASVAFRSADGAETVIPAAGLLACQP